MKGNSLTNKEADITFCLPVYNVYPFLEECISSIIMQNINAKYEIVCVDDGSTDGSYEKLLEMSSTEERIRVFKNPSNKGVGHTRNVALKNARGEYIWFVDPDDMLYPNVVNSLYEASMKEKADVCIGNYMRISEQFSEELLPVGAVIFNQNKRKIELPHDSNGTKMCAIWAGLFRRKFLLDNGLFFRENMISQEDTLFYYEVEQKVEKVLKTDAICYLYRQRSTSVMHSKSEERTRAYYQSMKIMLEVYQTYWNEKKYRDGEQLKAKIHHSQENVAVCLAMCNGFRFIKKELYQLRKEGMYPYSFRVKTLKSKIGITRKICNFLMPIQLCFWIIHFLYSMVNQYKYIKYKRQIKK